MSVSYYKNQLITNLADSTKINYKAYYKNYELFGANTDTGDTPTPPQPSHDYSQDYFTIVAKSNGTIKISPTVNEVWHEGEFYDCSYEDEETGEWIEEWCQDEGYYVTSYSDVWYFTGGTDWIGTEGETTINVSSGDTVMVKCKLSDCVVDNGDGTWSAYDRPCLFTGSTASFDVQGNIMSLLWGDDFRGETSLTYTYTYIEYDPDTWDPIDEEGSQDAKFNGLFGGTSVVDASNLVLPATEMTSEGYRQMFENCTSLTTAPELPATSLYIWCYYAMFKGCTSLTTAPSALPSTNLFGQCYGSMFEGCTSLTTVPFTLSASTVNSDAYQSMFKGCTSLTTAPDILATTMQRNACHFMFNGCTNLNYIKAMFTTTPSTAYTQNWVSGVAASGTFVKNSAATWNVRGNNGIPTNWTVQTASS